MIPTFEEQAVLLANEVIEAYRMGHLTDFHLVAMAYDLLKQSHD